MRLGNRDKYFAFGAEMARSLARFALGVAVARWVGPEAFAAYVLLSTAEVTLHTVCNSVWATPMATIAPGLEEPRRSALIGHAARRHRVGTLASGLLLGVLAPWAVARGVPALHYAGFVATVVMVGLLNMRRTWLTGVFRARAMFQADVCSTALPVAAVGLAWWRGGDVLATFWWSRAAGAALSLACMRRAVGPPPAAEGFELGRFRDMGRHMLVGSIANSVCARVQPFVLAAASTATQVGFFGAATALVGPLRMLTVALGGVLRPRLALHFGRGDRERGLRAASAAIGGVALGGALGLLAVRWIGEDVVRLVFGAEYAGLGGLLGWAAVYATVASVTALLAVLIQATDGARTTARLRLGAGALTLVLVWPACALLGAEGAFLSLIAAEATYLAAGVSRLVRVGALRAQPAARAAEPELSNSAPT